MQNNSSTLTRLFVPGVVMLCATLTVGCASNRASTEAKQPENVAMQDKPVESTQVESQPAVMVPVPDTKPADSTQLTSEESRQESKRLPQVKTGEHVQPEQMIFFFKFDQSALAEKDIEVIKQHARFMLDNPGLILQISGHTDQHGPRVYNEYLSKQRAAQVARIMITAGVPESQLLIKALADAQPLADNENTRKNRRVELEYQELNVVSNK